MNIREPCGERSSLRKLYVLVSSGMGRPRTGPGRCCEAMTRWWLSRASRRASRTAASPPRSRIRPATRSRACNAPSCTGNVERMTTRSFPSYQHLTSTTSNPAYFFVRKRLEGRSNLQINHCADKDIINLIDFLQAHLRFPFLQTVCRPCILEVCSFKLRMTNLTTVPFSTCSLAACNAMACATAGSTGFKNRCSFCVGCGRPSDWSCPPFMSIPPGSTKPVCVEFRPSRSFLLLSLRKPSQLSISRTMQHFLAKLDKTSESPVWQGRTGPSPSLGELASATAGPLTGTVTKTGRRRGLGGFQGGRCSV